MGARRDTSMGADPLADNAGLLTVELAPEDSVSEQRHFEEDERAASISTRDRQPARRDVPKQKCTSRPYDWLRTTKAGSWASSAMKTPTRTTATCFTCERK